MTGAEGSVAMLAEHLVRIVVGHVVSSSSMVSRAYLTDSCVGVIVDAGERGLFLVSSLAALVPDPLGLRVRAAEKGGIPVDAGEPRLVDIKLRWESGLAELKNPTVNGSGGIGVVSLAVPASFGARIRSGEGPRPVDLAADVALGLGERIAIPTATGVGPVVRWARVASDPGYGGMPDALALDLALAPDLAGSPAFDLDGSEPRFCGLVMSVDATTSVLRSPSALLAAIPG
jgi:hypothetical protein